MGALVSRFKISSTLAELKTVGKFKQMVTVVSYLSKNTKGFAKIGLPILLFSYLVRGFANGFLIPYSISFVVEGLKEYLEDKHNLDQLLIGLLGFGGSGAIFAISELALMTYLKKLSQSIVLLKEKALMNISSDNDNINSNKEDFVGVVANDIDFVVWNINGVLTTLLPNAFTALTALIAIYGLGPVITPYVFATVLPYLIYTELYIRKIEYQRYMERKTYALSIVFIRDYVYESKEKTDLRRVLERWKYHVDKIMWYDRLFFAASLGTALGSTAIVSYVVSLEAIKGRVGLGGVAGLLSAFLTAHFGVLNTMWAICIQGQVGAAFERMSAYLTSPKKKSEVRATLSAYATREKQ